MPPIALVLALGALGAVGCANPDGPASNDDDPPREPEASVEIGLPSGDDDLEFAPLEPDGEVRLQTFGQGGTHVLIGVRTTGFGSRAFVSITLANLHTGATVRTPAPIRPQLLYCDEEGSTCDLVPLLATTSGLTEPGTERDGVPIEISATVKNEAGVEAHATQSAVLSTADL